MRNKPLMAIVAAAALTLSMPNSANALVGSWDFDTDPGLLVLDEGSNPDFNFDISGSILSLSMTRTAAKERLFVDLPGGPYGVGNIYRIRSRYRTTSAAFAQIAVGFYAKDSPNTTTSPNSESNIVHLEWSDSLTTTGHVSNDRERPSVDVNGNELVHESDKWLISELIADFPGGTWFMQLFDGDTKELVAEFPFLRGANSFGAVDPINIFSFTNEDCCAADRFFTMDFDWVTYSIDEDLPADPPNARPELNPDLNMDGIVDGLDLGILLGNWNTTTTPDMGELNGTPPVDGLDLGILLGHWNAAPLGAVASVPEPTSLSLLLLTCLAVTPRRARR